MSMHAFKCDAKSIDYYVVHDDVNVIVHNHITMIKMSFVAAVIIINYIIVGPLLHSFQMHS